MNGGSLGSIVVVVFSIKKDFFEVVVVSNCIIKPPAYDPVERISNKTICTLLLVPAKWKNNDRKNFILSAYTIVYITLHLYK